MQRRLLILQLLQQLATYYQAGERLQRAWLPVQLTELLVKVRVGCAGSSQQLGASIRFIGRRQGKLEAKVNCNQRGGQTIR